VHIKIAFYAPEVRPSCAKARPGGVRKAMPLASRQLCAADVTDGRLRIRSNFRFRSPCSIVIHVICFPLATPHVGLGQAPPRAPPATLADREIVGDQGDVPSAEARSGSRRVSTHRLQRGISGPRSSRRLLTFCKGFLSTVRLPDAGMDKAALRSPCSRPHPSRDM